METISAIALNDDPARTRKLEGIIGGADVNTMGDDPGIITMPIEPFAVDSARTAFEMAEVFAMALLRDVPFVRLSTDTVMQSILTELNKFPDKSTAPLDQSGILTPRLFLRANVPGAVIGPYVSQLLVQPFLCACNDSLRMRPASLFGCMMLRS